MANWVVPPGLVLCVYECWGGGGPGRRHSHQGGGGGGQYSMKLNVVTIPGQVNSMTLGAGGVATSATNGGNTLMRSNAVIVCQAQGGTISNGLGNPDIEGEENIAGGIGDVIRFGGNGGIPVATPPVTIGCGGGGGGGRAAPGSNGGGSGLGTGGPGGDVGFGTGGPGQQTGTPPLGVLPGGGGGGCGDNGSPGANGRAGALAVWDAADWNFGTNEPDFGAVPVYSEGSYTPAPVNPFNPKTTKRGFIM